MRLKKVLNLHEVVTHKRLSDACDRVGASVFAKVRLADVLPIERSGIDSDLYAFALRSHFDFLVTDSDHSPLFVVEFDGPSHDSPKQLRRDLLKNRLCDRFDLPMLRVNARYLTKTYGTMDLLTWFVDVWFLARAFEEAQQSGTIPWDEPFDHKFLMPGECRGVTFPWWLAADVEQKLRKLSEEGRCWDPGSSWIVGHDQDENHRALGYIRITRDSGVSCTTGMRRQRFPGPIDELLGDIVTHELCQRVVSVLDGSEIGESIESIKAKMKQFADRYDFCSVHSTSRGEPLRA